MNANDSIRVSFRLTNTGSYAGSEVVQLYLRNKVASVIRPVKELKDFKKVFLQPGESTSVEFNISRDKLIFLNQQLKWGTEPGDFELMIGSSSEKIKFQAGFEYTDE